MPCFLFYLWFTRSNYDYFFFFKFRDIFTSTPEEEIASGFIGNVKVDGRLSLVIKQQAETCALVLFSHKTQCFEVLKCQQDRVAAMYMSKLKTICSHQWQEMIKFHCRVPEICWNLTLPCQSQFTPTLNLGLNLTSL